MLETTKERGAGLANNPWPVDVAHTRSGRRQQAFEPTRTERWR